MRAGALLFLVVAFAAGLCGQVDGAEPPDPERHYVIYLHGGIVTGSDGRPVSPRFGPYEYRAILRRFEQDGFVVLSEIRQDDGNVEANASRVAASIARLKAAGVPSRRIAVVGASMGGIIAAKVASALADPELTYVLIASLYRMTSEPVVALHGRVLSIHDEADDRPMIPEVYFEQSPDLAEARRLVTQTGLGHGLLYTPHAAWYEPAVDWIRRKPAPGAS